MSFNKNDSLLGDILMNIEKLNKLEQEIKNEKENDEFNKSIRIARSWNSCYEEITRDLKNYFGGIDLDDSIVDGIIKILEEVKFFYQQEIKYC